MVYEKPVKGKGHIKSTTMIDTIYRMPRRHNGHLSVISPVISLYRSTPVRAKSFNLHLLNHSPALSQMFPRRRKRRKRKNCSDFN